MYHCTVLPNGLRVLTCPMPHVRSTTLCFYISSGSRFESAAKAGLAHFLEHMAFKGTLSYPTARHISEAIEGVGGVLDASTSSEVTAYWTKVAVQHFPLALDLLSEMLLYPRLDLGEIEKERRVIIEELHMITDSPVDWVFRLITETLWPDHALGRDVAGTEEAVASICREDLQTFRDTHYIAENIVAVVAGASPAGNGEEVITAALEKLPPHPLPAAEPVPEEVLEPRIRLGFRDIEQANLCLGLSALSYRHPDRYVLALLSTILGGGMSSRLFQEIREQRALAYSIHSSIRQYADTGALTVYAGVDPERIEECLGAVWGELERLAGESVSEEELVRAKEYNKGRILLRMEDSYGVASWYGMQAVVREPIQEVDEIIAKIEAVRPADLLRLAGTLFRQERLRLAVVGPFRDEELMRRALGL